MTFNKNQSLKAKKPSWFYLVLLILSGEAIFILPFVLPRVFRPTVLDVLELDNVELGLCFSVYGLVAICFWRSFGRQVPTQKVNSRCFMDDSTGRFFVCPVPSNMGASDTLWVVGVHHYISFLGAYDQGNPNLGRD